MSDNHHNQSLSTLGEFGLIERLRAAAAGTLPPGVIGIGDDCAVIPAPGASLLMTTDLMVEGRHFDWALTSAFDLGWKLLAVNLSDIAACGGKPIAALFTLQVRPGMESAIVEEIYRGAKALAALHQVAIVGGDTVSATEAVFGATILGSCENPILRSGAKAGDELWVSGCIGYGGLGLAAARGAIIPALAPHEMKRAQEKYTRPVPRIELGRRLSEEKLATAMLDVSDGFFQDAAHLAAKSGVRIIIDLDAVPALTGGSWSMLNACSAGDDYELLFTAPATAAETLSAVSSDAVPLTRVGRAEAGEPGVLIQSAGGTAEPLPVILERHGLRAGHDHFQYAPPPADSE